MRTIVTTWNSLPTAQNTAECNPPAAAPQASVLTSDLGNRKKHINKITQNSTKIPTGSFFEIH
jgi:hypothetical protein